MMSDVDEPVNIGNPYEMTIIDFARKILDLTSSKSDIIFEDLPVDDPKVRQPDIGRAKRLLDWEPRVSLEDGLKAAIEFFKSTIR